MKILLLDEPVYSTASLLDDLKKLGSVKAYYDKPQGDVIVERLNDADIAIVRWTSISRDILIKLNRLRYIILAGTGFPKVDLASAREQNIVVSNVPNYCEHSVAEHVFALILALNRRMISSNRSAHMGEYKPNPLLLGYELYQKTLGIIGLGHIGSCVARIGLGFGMRVLGNARTKRDIPGVAYVGLDTVLIESDVVSLNVDLNETSRGLITSQELQKMKRSALLICTSNTAVIDESALFTMLRENRLMGAAIDSSCKYKKLRELDNVLLTPGSAWYTQEALHRIGETIKYNIISFINGKHVNVIT